MVVGGVGSEEGGGGGGLFCWVVTSTVDDCGGGLTTMVLEGLGGSNLARVLISTAILDLLTFVGSGFG